MKCEIFSDGLTFENIKLVAAHFLRKENIKVDKISQISQDFSWVDVRYISYREHLSTTFLTEADLMTSSL